MVLQGLLKKKVYEKREIMVQIPLLEFFGFLLFHKDQIGTVGNLGPFCSLYPECLYSVLLFNSNGQTPKSDTKI